MRRSAFFAVEQRSLMAWSAFFSRVAERLCVKNANQLFSFLPS